tara:strand:+ start:1216 stop:1686 length:471 start_codon:yes stop_codon:yes gene_type:complete
MDINGSVNAGELEFTIELDTDDVWNEIEDAVESKAYDVAQEAAREAIDNADFSVDYTQGATDLLREYNPGTGCSLAREFESAVQGAVSVNDFLKDVVLEQIREHSAGAVAVDLLPSARAVDADAVREIVRTEIRCFLADASQAVRERAQKVAGLTV